MTSSTKNYLEQYSRTKNIHQIQKNRNSYKQLLQNSKTRDNSHSNTTTTVHLKINSQLRQPLIQGVGGIGIWRGEKERDRDIGWGHDKEKERDKEIEREKEKQRHITSVMGCETQPLLSNTQNMQNMIHVSYNKLNTKMKLKVNATVDKSLRSMSSHDQLLRHQNSLVVSSMANIGVGLSSNKKKTKLVTLTSQAMPSTKKIKSHVETSAKKDKTRSISQTHNNSTINSKYSTSIAHEAAYRSIKRQIDDHCGAGERRNLEVHLSSCSQKRVENGERSGQRGGEDRESGENGENGGLVDREKNQKNNVEIVTLNSSMLRDGNCLQDVYDRIKDILAEHETRQKQWQQQRTYYKQKIRNLQKALQKQRTLNTTKTQINHTTSQATNQFSKSKQKQKQKQKSTQKKSVSCWPASNYSSHFSNVYMGMRGGSQM